MLSSLLSKPLLTARKPSLPAQENGATFMHSPGVLRRRALSPAASPSRAPSSRRGPRTVAAATPPSSPPLLAHLRLALDSTPRLALPYGGAPAEGVKRFSDAVWGAVGCFVSFLVVGAMDTFLFAPQGVPFMLGSFGTISILYFAAGLKAPLLRPHNIVVGHLLASTVAYLAVMLIQPPFVARAVGMAATVFLMLMTGSVHPPGGALVVMLTDNARLRALGPLYILFPGLAGALVLMVGAALTDALKQRFVFEAADVAAVLGFRGRPAPKTA